jgi:hypothetical protein
LIESSCFVEEHYVVTCAKKRNALAGEERSLRQARWRLTVNVLDQVTCAKKWKQLAGEERSLRHGRWRLTGEERSLRHGRWRLTANMLDVNSRPHKRRLAIRTAEEQLDDSAPHGVRGPRAPGRAFSESIVAGAGMVLNHPFHKAANGSGTVFARLQFKRPLKRSFGERIAASPSVSAAAAIISLCLLSVVE